MDITLPMSEVVSASSGIWGGVCLSGLWRHFDHGQQKHVNLSARFEIEFSIAANQRIIFEKYNSLWYWIEYYKDVWITVTREQKA